ncbi:hypothetical protein H696_02428 [Fonticula alba]|uniref:Endonuclease/exonuclease/phosphatase domain-containing protein n=1 Tax=Fonticula alba TaxID=691883 RepID=A0A058ZDG4_FONAL|nr:hypothetical protein H696_02428 [Fonticula alba]KCV71482.1 hypothetical protein H696_02428 [Fonticula alba]|eukprot:XP_009494605.1 hypothetical protein H696_02428 [Fonticula alba]
MRLTSRLLIGLLLVCLLAVTRAADAAAPPDQGGRPSLPSASLELNLLSFNIRYANPGDAEHIWENRREHAVEIMGQRGYDVVGLQEVLSSQLDFIIERLDEYAHVGVGRDDGHQAGEYSPIFFRKDRFALLESGTFWFCDEPSLPACKSYGNSIPRISTWARLLDLASQKPFLVYSLHMDHVSSTSRLSSSQQLARTVSLMNGERLPVILLGDFNNQSESSPEVLALQRENFIDTFRVVNPLPSPGETFHAFSGMAMRKFDYVFVQADSPEAAWQVTVKDANINREYRPDPTLGAIFPSDHFPIWAQVAFDYPESE